MQLGAILALAIMLVNLGYGLERSCRPLGEFNFISRVLAGSATPHQRFVEGANRFRGSWLGTIPVPLPANYVRGVDVQKRDFETGAETYFAGEWSVHGRWDFYLFGLAIKTPVETLLLLLLALSAADLRRLLTKDECLLLAPSAAVFVLVSSQTGINSHLRYILPALPFLFIFSGRCFAARPFAASSIPAWRTQLGIVALVITMVSSAHACPHYIGYFNSLSGGMSRTPPLLLGSSCDWGQDLLLLRQWYDSNGRQGPITLAATSGSVPAAVGLVVPEPPKDQHYRFLPANTREDEVGPQPGLHAVSVNRLFAPHQEFDYLQQRTPVCVIGNSIYVYQIESRHGSGDPQQR